MKKAIQTLFIVQIAGALFLSTGCGTLGTKKAQYAGVDSMLARGEFSAAAAQIEAAEHTHYRAKDRVLYLLDLGMLQHYLGDYEASNLSLEEAEQAMEAAQVKSVSRGAASLLLNDNVRTYAGEDYEDIYVNVFKALNYLQLDAFDEAFVEIRRVDEKLKGLESRYWKLAQDYETASQMNEPFKVGQNRFQDSVLARWLSLLIYRAEGRDDEAAIDLKKMARARALQPDLYDFRAPNLASALRPAAPGTVKVSFLGLVGQAPEKRADTLWIHTQADHVFVASSREKPAGGGQHFTGGVPIYWKGIEAGYTFKFQLPRLELKKSAVRSATVVIGGKHAQRLELLERLDHAAEATFEVQKPLTYLKTIARTVSKGVAAAQVQNKAEERLGSTGGVFAGLLAGLGVAATEQADLRIARFFPAQAHVAELDLLPGTYSIQIEYYGPGGTVLYRDDLGAVKIRRNGLNLIESVYLN